ncbi:hypothetical protein, partial [Xenorhabdus entomophaga]|uniref:hypothetical protein n=1 Tax=Xenorhabdus entomophaga TaxID=3136257 RepID=UPI0030F3D09C
TSAAFRWTSPASGLPLTLRPWGTAFSARLRASVKPRFYTDLFAFIFYANSQPYFEKTGKVRLFFYPALMINK